MINRINGQTWNNYGDEGRKVKDDTEGERPSFFLMLLSSFRNKAHAEYTKLAKVTLRGGNSGMLCFNKTIPGAVDGQTNQH